MKAYNHVSERIDAVYKDLTRGKAAPMGGVAYLSLEDSEVRGWRPYFLLFISVTDGIDAPL
jgi:hypothetical protein